MGIDSIGIDSMGIDSMGIDSMGIDSMRVDGSVKFHINSLQLISINLNSFQFVSTCYKLTARVQ